jgi:sialate O-acetylesterase
MCSVFIRFARVAPAALTVCLGLLPSAARAEVKMSGYFTDHMVLQREMAAPIYGQAAPNEKVTVEFHGQQKTATAAADGKWLVKLDPLTAGGPWPLVIRGGNTITIDDVLVGDVWVGSGQSNMQRMVALYGLPGPEHDEMLIKLANEPHPRIRLVKRGVKPVWQECNMHNLTDFSALLFAFGQGLEKELDVPIGLMMGAVGDTPSACWISPEALAADADCQSTIRLYAEANPMSKLTQ